MTNREPEARPRLTPAEFAAKWSGSKRTERAASQEHFIDLCGMLGVLTPNEADPEGEWYAFEKGAEKTDGSDGYADVWKRGHFGWEYKRKGKDLFAAYKQLLDYREALENPPLLVVCDIQRIEVHTNFTDSIKQIHAFTLDQLATNPAEPLRVLRALMSDPNALRPQTTRKEITEAAASKFAALAQKLRDRGNDPHRVAHFLNKLLFAMFAEDAGLLPKELMKRIADGTRGKPSAFADALTDLFSKMSDKGGLFGAERIEWFNGGLFDGADVIPLEPDEIDVVRAVSDLDWSEVEPSIFGTLFVRGLDPDKRSQLGAQYTDRESILRLVEPVVMTPLRREFATLKEQVLAMLPDGERTTRRLNAAEKAVQAFLARLAKVRVLDPACGSGNFLYVALQLIKDLENQVTHWASETLRKSRIFPSIGPEILLGIEVNDYAAELARLTIWIGEIQWMVSHGFSYRKNPILEPLKNIERADAILDLANSDQPKEPDWPPAEFIVGNPPFLGNKLLRGSLGNEYVEKLFEVYAGRVPGEADLVTYWHEKARAAIEKGTARRVGLLATQGIRGGANRRVLARIKESGDIFLAWSDEPWVLEGAAVHVSFVGFDNGAEKIRTLDGILVPEIHPDLSTGADLTTARRLRENLGIAFQGPVKVGKFELAEAPAKELLLQPNPHRKPNRDVVRPWINGLDLTRRPRRMWIVDFGEMSEEEAARYEAPFEHVRKHVKPFRERGRRQRRAQRWWLHGETVPGLRAAIAGLGRFIVTPRVSKHRLFAWAPAGTLPDSAIIAIARDDDYTFGVLHSRVHEVWALKKGTQLETRPRYTPTSTFETFPFPLPSPTQRDEIAAAARELNELRDGWLNPTGLSDRELKARTLTNLYNSRPMWLANAHSRLDRAVLDAYGWPHNVSEVALLAGLLALNLQRKPV